MLRQGVLGLAGSEGDHGPSIYSQVAAGLKDHVEHSHGRLGVHSSANFRRCAPALASVDRVCGRDR